MPVRHPKPARQQIFGGAGTSTPSRGDSDDEESNTRSAQNRIAAAMANNANSGGQDGGSSSSNTPQEEESISPSPPVTNDNNTNSADETANTTANIQLLLKQLMELSAGNGTGSDIGAELREYYLRQMRLRDWASRQLRNI